MLKTLVILNPISGNGAGEKLWPAIDSALHQGGLEFEMSRTTAPRAGIAIAEQAKREGYDLLIAIGGDGTVNEVANGMLRAAAGETAGTLGVIPVGSGNDFTKILSSNQDWEEGVRRILSGQTRVIDVGKIIGDKPAPGYASEVHYFVNGLDAGFGALVAQHAHEVPFLRGTTMYLAAVLKTLWSFSIPHLRIDLDADPIEQDSTMIAFGNGRCIGGGFWITPTASADDGLLDVMIADGLGRLGILSLLPKVMKGTHVGDPRVKFLQASHILIESPDPLTVEADGEIPYIGAHHLEIELLPKKLCVAG